MAVSYTSNLRLRIEEGITPDALYNLQRIDELGANLQVTTAANVELSSAEDVFIQPNNPASGGSGVGGLVQIGSSIQPIDLLDVYAKKLSFHQISEINFGTATLTGAYTIPWDRLDLDNADLSGLASLDAAILDSAPIKAATAHINNKSNPHEITASQLGTYTSGQIDALIEAKASIAALSSHTDSSSHVHGIDGNVVGTTDAQALSNKQIDADNNLITNIKNSNIAQEANIDGSKIYPQFGTHQIRTSGGIRLDGSTSYIVLDASAANQSGPVTLKLPSTYGQNGQVLTTDGQGNLSWQNPAGAAITQRTFYWEKTDGTELTINHGFNNKNLDITVRDQEDGELIYIPDINILDNNTILMVSSEPPSVSWQITIQAVVL